MEKAKEFKWPLIGNRHISEYLEKAINKGKLNGPYIFHGPDNLGKTTMASYFANILLCQNYGQPGVLPCGTCDSCRRFRQGPAGQEDLGSVHGDFHILKKQKDKKNIPVEEVREFIRILGMSSFLNSYKIGVIKHADAVSQEGANALLKTLEEPNRKVIIILVTNRLDALLPTIISRSQVFHFRPVEADTVYDFLIKEKGASRSEARNLSRLCQGRPALAVKFMEDKQFREKYLERMEVFLDFFDQDINARLKSLDRVIEKTESSQEAATQTLRTLEIWQAVLRDLVLLQYNHHNLASHIVAEKKLESAGRRLGAGGCLPAWKLLSDSRTLLHNNVNPRNILENIAINI